MDRQLPQAEPRRLTIPFASGYKAPWMAIGVIGAWLMVILGVSYYARERTVANAAVAR